MYTSKNMSSLQNKRNLEKPEIADLDNDFTLIKNFIDGEESAFQELVKLHSDKVRNIIYVTVNRGDYVDDIAQDVFITVYKNLKNFRFESQFTTWLYRITINKCRDYLRKMKIRNIFSPIKEAEEKSSFSNATEEKDVKRFVRDAIKKLPDKLRTPLLLKDIEGFSYQEIAETVGCEIGTVKSRIFRAREGLREILKPYEQELML